MTNKISIFIKSLREKKEWSQQGIADQLGISRSSYIAFENGDRELTLDEASILSKIFEISLDEIKNGEFSTPPIVLEKTKDKENLKDEPTERISVPQENVDKFKQVLMYVLSKIGGKPNIGKTVLYKILYFIDFDYYEKFEEQLIGARYIKNTHGPTPVAFEEIVNDLESDGKLETVKSKFYRYEQTKYLVNPTQPLDVSKLTGREMAHINEEIDRFSDFTASQISTLSHKDTPWLVAKDKEIIDYEHVFYRPEETSVREYEPL
ncbi:MAG: type II toxin-antitoxin system antitoxin SocA domain-containing protein [Candidatus Paceibacterota bacterium]|jgi:transcriptional regulator with XRE-family HTH domain